MPNGHSNPGALSPSWQRGSPRTRALSCFGREGMRREAVPEPPGSLGPVLFQGIPDRPQRWGAIGSGGQPFERARAKLAPKPALNECGKALGDARSGMGVCPGTAVP